MKLTRQEQKMLDGKMGGPVQKAMEILVGLGECFDAQRMLPVNSVHLAGNNIHNAGQAGAAFFKDMADRGGKFITFTDTNISAIDHAAWHDMGIPEDFARQEIDLNNDLGRLGAYRCNTCTPYIIGHVPRFGENVAWGESSAIVFVNSVLGARTNRYGAPAGAASALTGRVAAYGLHLDENRYGDLKIKVTAKLDDMSDYGALGYFAGKIAHDRVPVMTGVPASVTWDDLKALGGASATSGSVALYHIVGVTPEAPTEKAAFGSRKVTSSEIYEFGKKELEEVQTELNTATTKHVDFVMVGCPNCSIAEIAGVARLIEGKKVKPGVAFWVMTSPIVKAYAEKLGYANIIRTSGARIVCETCPNDLPRNFLRKKGLTAAAMNSAKMSHYIYAAQDLNTYFGSAARCVSAAISGTWS